MVEMPSGLFYFLEARFNNEMKAPFIKTLKWKAILLGWLFDTVSAHVLGTLVGLLLVFVHKIYLVPEGELSKYLVSLPEFLPFSIALGYFCSFLGGLVVAKLARTHIYPNALCASFIAFIFTCIVGSQGLPLWVYYGNIAIIPGFYLLGAYLYKRL